MPNIWLRSANKEPARHKGYQKSEYHIQMQAGSAEKTVRENLLF